MQGLVAPTRLRARIDRWIEEEAALGNLPLKAGAIIDAILYRGELPRSERDAVIGTGDRQARRIASSLLDLGVVISESSRTAPNGFSCGIGFALDARSFSGCGPSAFGDDLPKADVGKVEARSSKAFRKAALTSATDDISLI